MEVSLKIEVNDVLSSVNADRMSRREENECDSELMDSTDKNEIALFVCKIRLEKLGTYRQFFILKNKLKKMGISTEGQEPQSAEIKVRMYGFGLD